MGWVLELLPTMDYVGWNDIKCQSFFTMQQRRNPSAATSGNCDCSDFNGLELGKYCSSCKPWEFQIIFCSAAIVLRIAKAMTLDSITNTWEVLLEHFQGIMDIYTHEAVKRTRSTGIMQSPKKSFLSVKKKKFSIGMLESRAQSACSLMTPKSIATEESLVSMVVVKLMALVKHNTNSDISAKLSSDYFRTSFSIFNIPENVQISKFERHQSGTSLETKINSSIL
jgi:hypothetical protein